MTAGVIQLVAYGHEDLFLTRDPQITFFKIIYRRHTNFSTEDIPQYFIHEPDFGKRTSCLISQNAGDMIDKMCLQIILPAIPKLTQTPDHSNYYLNHPCHTLKFAWVRKIGFAMLRYVEFEINGKVIDRHYGEWLYIWTWLTTRNINDRGMNKLIGDVPELTEFTESKEAYVMYVPLQFWFCRSSGLALPLVGLQFSDIKINIEFYDLDKCYILSPTHYIRCTTDIVNFLPYEYLYQKGFDGVDRYGIFAYYDSINRRLYYTAITNEKFTGVPLFDGDGNNEGDPHTLSEVTRQTILSTPKTDRYLIRGVSTDFAVKPDLCTKSVTVHRKPLNNLKLQECFILAEFVYLDNDERQRFAQSKHDYLIEQLYYTPDVSIDGCSPRLRLDIDQPCKLMVWLAQLDYIYESNDRFNYTDSHITRRIYDPYTCDPAKIKLYDCVKIGGEVGKPLIDDETLRLNSQIRVSPRPHAYFEYLQADQYAVNPLPKGVGMYSYGIIPLDPSPSGTTNMSQIELIDLTLKMNYVVNTHHRAKFRSYALCYNVWRVDNGLSAPIFIK